MWLLSPCLPTKSALYVALSSPCLLTERGLLSPCLLTKRALCGLRLPNEQRGLLQPLPSS